MSTRPRRPRRRPPPRDPDRDAAIAEMSAILEDPLLHHGDQCPSCAALRRDAMAQLLAARGLDPWTLLGLDG